MTTELPGTGAADRAARQLEGSAERCHVVALQIWDGQVQELAALAFSLGAAAASAGLGKPERTRLLGRAEAIQCCSRLLCAVAQRLDGISVSVLAESPADVPLDCRDAMPPAGSATSSDARAGPQHDVAGSKWAGPVPAD